MKKPLPPCNPVVFEKGEVVFVGDTIPACQVEKWVRKIAAQSGQQMDWHYLAGRAVVKALGGLELVRATVEALKPEYDALHARAVARLRGET